MGYSAEWDAVYGAGLQQTSWPWSDLVGLVRRHLPADLSGIRVLELGCGTGANVPFFLASGARYSAIEGSATAVAVVHERFPDLRKTVVMGDFTQSMPAGPFDLVVDRASVTHNSAEAIGRTLAQAWDRLVEGGYYIGIDWFSERHSDRGYGVPAEDPNTFSAFGRGQFKGCGRVHFSDERHLRELFSRFEILLMREKLVRQLEPGPDHLAATLDILARKPRVAPR